MLCERALIHLKLQKAPSLLSQRTVGAVLRISFGNFLFFALNMLVTLGVRRKDDPRAIAHTALWAPKFIIWAGLIGMTFALPNHVFYVYGQIARVLSGFFLILQIIILLDWFFGINEWLLSRDGWPERVALICGSALFFLGSLAVLGVLYHFYAPFASCSLNIFFITWTLITAIVYTMISVSPWRMESAGLLTAGMVFAYATFLLWSALTSEPLDARCVYSGGTGSKGVKIVGFLLGLAAILFTTLTSSTESKTLDMENGAATNDDLLPYRPDFFHLVFLLASAYLAMLFTSWSLDQTPGEFVVDKGWISVWVKMVSQWVCTLLYLWSLVAPRLLANRSFN
ncbi:hypothetical protein WJX72_009404 [[Myrmecia] bisecta]|uniref:Serine incorporator n=1 Tax=[Myrmecia] bisecta TaxID=41462 RepID=A0AAW1PP55_9CHLO